VPFAFMKQVTDHNTTKEPKTMNGKSYE
jgi:hypothetical protein